MKRIFPFFLLLVLSACSKEKTASLKGNWSFVEVISMGVHSQADPDQSTVEFKSDGSLVVNMSQTSARSALANFDRYEMPGEQEIRFINSTTGESMKGYTRMEDDGLWLTYSVARCPYEEHFIRPR